MKVDFARAKAKRDSCLFYRQHSHRGHFSRAVCEKIGYKRPFLATCSSCHSYTPMVAVDFFPKKSISQTRKGCVVCGAYLHMNHPKANRCHGPCKNSLLAYFPSQKIIIEEIRGDDLYGLSLT